MNRDLSTSKGREGSLLKRRYAAERRFRFYGQFCTALALLALFTLLFTILKKGYSGFQATVITLEVEFAPESLGISDDWTTSDLVSADYYTVLTEALYRRFPSVIDRKDRKELKALVSMGAQFDLREALINDPTHTN